MKINSKNKRFVKASEVEMTELVLPNDTNQLGNLLGGRLMEWIDIAAAIAAQRHSNRVCVTAALDNLVFHHPIHLGEVVTLRASVNRVFSTSMEVGVKVIAENQLTSDRRVTNTAYLTFVAVDDHGKSVKVSPIHPQTVDEKKRYKEALVRRDTRLVQNNHKGNRRTSV
ncbi:MAG: acyl-CoA thioesterase [Chlorobiaceae bacterium]|nr:acyl-CoA thioesterase [Chlorobiaceae bacterium]